MWVRSEVWTSWLSFQSVTREAERFQFELPVRKKSRCLRFQEFVLLGFFFFKRRRLKDFFGNFLHKTRVSKWADSPSSWEEVLAFSSSRWRKLITETQQGLSASSAALMKPLLLLSFWSSGPEVYIFVLVWSHAWISTLLFEVGLFPSSLAAARSAEEWVMAGKMERKQDGYILFLLFHELLWIFWRFTIFLILPLTISSSRPCCGIILLHDWRTGSESALYICGI